jgi:hypothetical protein
MRAAVAGLLLLAVAPALPASPGVPGDPPPLVAWLRVDGEFVCGGAGLGRVASWGVWCDVVCYSDPDGACAFFARGADLAYIPLEVTYRGFDGSWVTVGRADPGPVCIDVVAMAGGTVRLVPLAADGAAGIANGQEDDGQYCPRE